MEDNAKKLELFQPSASVIVFIHQRVFNFNDVFIIQNISMCTFNLADHYSSKCVTIQLWELVALLKYTNLNRNTMYLKRQELRVGIKSPRPDSYMLI